MKVEVLAIVVVVLMIIGGIWYSLVDHSTANNPAKLPAQAANIVDEGNGWTRFTLYGTEYLYHRSYNGNFGYEAIAAIPNAD